MLKSENHGNVKLKADALLLLAAAIWGFAFVAQRQSMAYVTPFFFNGSRFLLGALVVLPFSGWKFSKEELKAGLIMGFVLFLAASLQQVGIVHTTAGKAGFITGLYMIFVPILGSLSGESSGFRTWLGVVTAVTGLYLLSMTDGAVLAIGDMLILLCALVFAVHVRLIGHYSRLHSPFKLAFLQYLVVGVLSLPLWIFQEKAATSGWQQSLIPIIYGGVLSAGIAYTLQIFAQRKAPAADCAVILSLEGAFAGLGGYLILGEYFSLRMLFGCALMLCGAILAGLPEKKKEFDNAPTQIT
ncbi:MAG: DMT family transporter [Candidatus Cloacimonetes bacterium]|nr:DMT family transporter [Candidatus Cloacimonadota bacterium]